MNLRFEDQAVIKICFVKISKVVKSMKKCFAKKKKHLFGTETFDFRSLFRDIPVIIDRCQLRIICHFDLHQNPVMYDDDQRIWKKKKIYIYTKNYTHYFWEIIKI